MWYELGKPVLTLAGTSGTLTFNRGAVIMQIIAQGASNATVTVPTGDGSTTQTIPVPAGTTFRYQANHLNRTMQGSGTALQITFTSTLSYFVEYQDVF